MADLVKSPGDYGNEESNHQKKPARLSFTVAFLSETHQRTQYFA
ncbi:MAG: hypothetical protein V7L01_08740 [Nostoc sp.]